MKHAIYILFTYHFIARTATNYLLNHPVYDVYAGHFYYLLDALMIGVVAAFIYMKSEHSYRNIAALTGVLLLALCQVVNTGVQLYTGDERKWIEYLPELMIVFIALDLLSLVFSKILKKWFSDGL